MKIEGYIGSEFALANLPDLWLQAAYKDQKWVFSGETKPGQEISLAEIQQHFLPHLKLPLPIKADLKVSDIHLEFAIEQGEEKNTYSLDFSGKMKAEWQFEFGNKGELSLEKLQLKLDNNKNLEFAVEIKPFSLTDLGVSLEFLADIQVKKTSFNISYLEEQFHTYLQGGIQIKGFEFDVNFTQSYDQEKQKKWIQFFGELKNTYSLADLGFFEGELRKVLPENIKDLRVEKLLVKYNSLNEEFVFEAVIKDIIHFDVNIGKLERIALNECSFLLQLGKEKKEVKIKGDLSINTTHFIANTKLSSKSGLSLEVFNQGKIEINFKDISDFIAGDLGIWNSIPPFFQKLELETVQLLFQTSPLLASMNIVSTHWGSIYGGIGKVNGTDNGIIVCLTPPGHIPFSEIHPDLVLIETLDLSRSYLILSSFASTSIKSDFLPERLKELQFIDGLTFCASLSLDAERIKNEELREKMRFFKQHVLDIQQLSVRGTLGLDPAKIAIEAYIGKIALGGGVVELSNAGIGLSANLDFTLFGALGIDLEQFIQIPKMTFSMYLKVQANGIVGYGIWEGNLGTREVKRLGEAIAKIEKAGSELLESYDQSQQLIKGNELFNTTLFDQIQFLPDLQIRKLALVLGISWQGVPSFGCLGEFTLNGDQDEHWGIIAFLFDSANPSKCLFDLKFPKDTQKSLEKIVLNFQKFVFEALGVDKNLLEQYLHENKIFRLLEFDGFYEDLAHTKWVPLRTKIAITDVKIGSVFYDMGILLQGKVGFLNNFLAAIFNVKITKSGIYGFGKLKKFLITINNTSLLELGESKQSLVSKDAVLKQNLDLVEAEFRGPYIILNAPFTDLLQAKLHGSAYINFLGSQLDTFYMISSEGLCFSLMIHTALGELNFKVVVESLTAFEAKSEFDLEFMIDVFTVKAKGSAGVSLKDTELKAHLKFDGEYYNPIEKKYISLGNFNIEFEAPPELVKIFTDVLKLIKDELMKLAGAIFEELKKIFAKLAEEIKQLAEEVQQIAKKIDEQFQITEKIKQGVEAGKEVLRLIGSGIEQIKQDLARLYEELDSIRRQIEDIARQIEQKMHELQQELDRAMRELGGIILRILGNIDKLTLPLLIEIRNTLQNEWNDAEGARVWHYGIRKQLESELNLWNAIPHGARIYYHLNLEGVNEGRKIALAGPRAMVDGFIGLSETIQGEINRLESEKQNAINTQNQKNATLTDKQNEERNKNSELQERQAQISQQEQEAQQAEALYLAEIENKRIKEEALIKKREELKVMEVS